VVQLLIGRERAAHASQLLSGRGERDYFDAFDGARAAVAAGVHQVVGD
jgi:hypothetical protein